MKHQISTGLVAGALCVVAVLISPLTRAADQKFSLTSGLANGFNYSTDKQEGNPWVFKLAAPVGITGIKAVVPQTGYMDAYGTSAQSGLVGSEAAASYNLYADEASSTGIDLTGKVKINMADKNKVFSFNQNNYAAQMDVYKSLDKFTAKGSLGSMTQGRPTGIALNPWLYGSFGGAYQFNDQASSGVDMNLSKDPSLTGAAQHELSAYVSYKLDKNFKARGYVLRGFSNGNTNSAVGGQVYYGF